MKNLRYTAVLSAALGLVLTFGSCDKVENPFPPEYNTELDKTLYPGSWNDYVDFEWPDFDTINAESTRNAIIEDFTGHNCSNCPTAATNAHDEHEQNPDHVFVASIHASSVGMSSFQLVNIAQGYTINFTNSVGLDLGQYFGTLANSGFSGNPSGTVNRVPFGTSLFYSSGVWGTKVSEVLGTSLKVAIKSHANYYDQTKGAFLHTEIELLDPTLDPSQLAVVAYLLEDTLVGPQNVSSTYTPDYVHRDIHRANLSNQMWGRPLKDDQLDNGKYYLDYSFVVPNQLAPEGNVGAHNAENMHVLIYVHNVNTYEIYQVVKQKFK